MNENIDKISYDLITKRNDYVQLRYTIYGIWGKWCMQNSLHPVYANIPETVAPLCFPVICKTKEQKNIVMQFLNDNNIAVFSWPDLPQEMRTCSNSGLILYNRIVCLPIHTKVNTTKLQQMFENLQIPPSLLA